MGRSWVLKRAPDYIIYLNNESDIARVVLSDQSNCKGMKGERKGEGGGGWEHGFQGERRREMEDGQREMENRQWKMENGKWEMESGRWEIGNGKWGTEMGELKMGNGQ